MAKSDNPLDKPAETTVEQLAEDLGRILGTAEARASAWLGQGKSMAQHLTAIRDKASELLAQIGSTSPAKKQKPRGRPARSGKKGAAKTVRRGPALSSRARKTATKTKKD